MAAPASVPHYERKAGMRGPMEEYPDELRIKAPAGKPDSGRRLGDFLWETGRPW